jgi:DNA replication protein DnaC
MAAKSRNTNEKPKTAAPSVPSPADAGIPLEDQRAFYFQARLERSRIPKMFLGKTLESFQTGGSQERKHVVAMARDYIESFGAPEADRSKPGLLLYGDTGSGKTHILASVLKELIAKGHSALYYNVPNLFKDIRATYRDDNEIDEDQLLEGIVRSEILALDDLGAEKTSDWVLDRLYLIINQRYEDCRPTLVTTNHDWPMDVERNAGKRIASRLAETCTIVGPFPKQDWRMKNANLERRMK